MLFLLYLSWKYYKDDEKPIMKSVLLGVAASWISFFDQSPLYGLLWWLPHLFFTVLLSFIVKKIIWLFAAGTNPTQRKQKSIREKTWLICLGIVFIYYLFFIAEANSWPEPSTFPGNWNQILLICLPFIYTFIFKRIKERLQLENTYALFKISICYFGSCAVLYLASLGLVHIISNPIAYRSLGRVSYYDLMGIIVYAVEIRAMRKEKREFAHWRGRAASFLIIVVYIVVCISATFFQNTRMREVFFHIGGKAVHISQENRLNWMGYRKAAVQSFCAGNTDMIERFYNENLEENYNFDIIEEDLYFQTTGKIQTYAGYKRFVSCANFGGVLFNYCFGRWWFCVLIVLIAMIAAVLLCRKWENPYLNRCKNYLAVSYLIRLVLSIFYIMGMFVYCEIDMPFTSYAMMDFVILAIFLRESRKNEGSWKLSGFKQLSDNST